MKSIVTFSINTRGEISGETFAGSFDIRTKLSLRDTLREDEIRRTILGAYPAGASPDSLNIAAASAYLAVRVASAPKWWTESNHGIDLVDPNVFNEVINKASEEVSKAQTEFFSEADRAQKELREKTE